MDVLHRHPAPPSSTACTSDQQESTTMAVDMMARGFEAHLGQSIDKISAVLNDILFKQQELLTKVHSDNKQLGQSEAVKNVHLTMLHTQQYYKKLLKIQKDMLELHKKRAKLKERANRITESVQRSQLDRQKQSALESQQAESIIAKPAGTKSDTQMDELPSSMTATPAKDKIRKGALKKEGTPAQKSAKKDKLPSKTASSDVPVAKFSSTITKVNNAKSSSANKKPAS